MTIYTLPAANWTLALAAIIEAAEKGDTIVAPNAASQELTERAIRRMCPDKDLKLVVQEASDRPIGAWQCLACGGIWDGSLLHRDPASMGAATWTCSNWSCGGTCMPLLATDR